MKVDRIVEFSGYKWIVKESHLQKIGPGPNFFSNSEQNVWVDQFDELHLKVAKS